MVKIDKEAAVVSPLQQQQEQHKFSLFKRFSKPFAAGIADDFANAFYFKFKQRREYKQKTLAKFFSLAVKLGHTLRIPLKCLPRVG